MFIQSHTTRDGHSTHPSTALIFSTRYNVLLPDTSLMSASILTPRSDTLACSSPTSYICISTCICISSFIAQHACEAAPRQAAATGSFVCSLTAPSLQLPTPAPFPESSPAIADSNFEIADSAFGWPQSGSGSRLCSAPICLVREARANMSMGRSEAVR